MYYFNIGKAPFRIMIFISLLIHVFVLTFLITLNNKEPELKFKTVKIKLGDGPIRVAGSKNPATKKQSSSHPNRNLFAMPSPDNVEKKFKQAINKPKNLLPKSPVINSNINKLEQTKFETNKDEIKEAKKIEKNKLSSNMPANNKDLSPGKQKQQLASKETKAKDLIHDIKHKQLIAELATKAERKKGLSIGNSNENQAAQQVQSYEKILLPLWLNYFREYPEQMRKLGVGGSGQILIVINRSGKVLRSRIAESTGNYYLDKALMDMVKMANPVLPVPKDHYMGKKIFSYQIKFDFVPPKKYVYN